MSILMDLRSECNKKINANFNGGEITSDAGMLLINEFAHKLGFVKLVKELFHTKDTTDARKHTDSDNLMQKIYQITAGYDTDDASDELTAEPVLTTIMRKEALASQPTISRFFGRMDKDTLEQLNAILRQARSTVYSAEKPKMVLLDADSTNAATYGDQEGAGFNAHYGHYGYHPLMVFDGLTKDLLKAELREGTVYTSNGIEKFLQPLLDEYQKDYRTIKLFFRGDSGFAVPGLYTQLESNSVSYAIRLKENKMLMSQTSYATDELHEKTKDNMTDYAVIYDEFEYQAGSWDYPRRVVMKAEKPYGQFTFLYTFIVTNMDLPPEKIIQFYCNRGSMENFIKEAKNDFGFGKLSSHSMITNANRMMVSVLAYNLFNWCRRLTFPDGWKYNRAGTIRTKLIKIGARLVKGAGYLSFKLCSSCPYKETFRKIWNNIISLKLKPA